MGFVSKPVQRDQDTSFWKKDEVILQQKNLPLKKLFLKNLFSMYQRIKLLPSGEAHVKKKNCIKQQTTSIVLLAANKEMLGVSTGRASFD